MKNKEKVTRQEAGAFLTAAPASWTPDVDLPRRVLRNAVFATTGLATDGRIILPKGIDFKTYLSNPIVTCRHVVLPDVPPQDGTDPIVVARTLRMHADDFELRGDEVQFADNELGRQYAYLYGVNPEREAYMRMWSIEAYRLESSVASFDQAKRIAGTYWDTNIATRIMAVQKNIPVWTGSVLTAVAAATLGADRAALTRAMKAGVALAGELVARMDLTEARNTVTEIKQTLSEQDGRIAQLEKQIQALGRDGASAAARGDSDALLKEIRALRAMVK